MGLIAIPNVFAQRTTAKASEVNANFSEVASKFNASAVLTDVAKTITVTHTFTPTQTFSGGASFGAAITVTGTITLSGAPALQYGTGTLTLVGGTTGTTIANNANSAPNLALTDAGLATFRNTLTVSAGGLTVSSGTTALQALTATSVASAGPISVTGNAGLPALTSGGPWIAGGFGSPVMGKLYIGDGSGWHFDFAKRIGSVDTSLFTFADSGLLTVSQGIVVSAGGLSVTGGITGTLSTAAQPNITSVGILAAPHLTSPVVDSGGLTVSAGGATMTGTVAVTGRIVVSAHGMFGAWDGTGDAGSLGVSNNTTTTATAGAQSLPASPAGFLSWRLGAASIKVPYYNA